MSNKQQRVSLIVELAEVSPIKAKFIDSIIEKVAFNQLVSFFRFRASFLKPYANKDYATVIAYEEWEKNIIEKKLQSGDFTFSDIYDMVNHIQKHYKGKKLVRGAKPFFGDVIVKLNDTGNMLNDTHHNNEGYATRISQKEESEVYEWLFLNQNKIGFTPVYIKDRDIQKQRAMEVISEKRKIKEEENTVSPEVAKEVSLMIRKTFGDMEKASQEKTTKKKEENKVSPSSLEIRL